MSSTWTRQGGKQLEKDGHVVGAVGCSWVMELTLGSRKATAKAAAAQLMDGWMDGWMMDG